MVVPTLELLGGYKIPVVGLGTWQCSNEAELKVAVNTSLENGYRHIDAAYAYLNEHVIGKVINEWISSGKLKREDLFITTKLPMEAVNPDRVEPYIKKSLTNLQLDYVDLYLVHFPVGTLPRTDRNQPRQTVPTDHIAVWKKMEEQVDAGRTKTIGLSNFNITQIERIIKNARIKPVSLQVEVHVYLQQKELVKFAQDNGIVVVAFSPLSSPGIENFYSKYGIENKKVPNILKDATIKRIADKHNKTSAQIALKFLIQKNIVVIPKSVTVKRIKENINLFDFALDEEDVEALTALDIGESGRVCDYSYSSVLADHPEWPFPK